MVNWNNADEWREALSRAGSSLRFTPDNSPLRRNKEAVLIAVRSQSAAMSYAHPDLWSDADVIEAALERSHIPEIAQRRATESQASNPELVRRILSRHGNMLQYVAPEIKFSEEHVLAAIRNSWENIRFAAPDLKASRSFMSHVLTEAPLALKHAHKRVKNARSVVGIAVERDGMALQFASDRLKADESLVEAAIQKNYEAFEHAHDELRNSKGFVLRMVALDQRSFRFAGEISKSDRDIVLEAVSRDGDALQYAGNDLKADEFIVEVAVRNKYEALKHADVELRNSKRFVLRMVGLDPRSFQFAGEFLKSDRAIVIAAVEFCGEMLEFAGDSAKSDRDIVLKAISQNGMALAFASEALKDNRSIVLEALSNTGRAFGLLPWKSPLRGDAEVALKAISKGPVLNATLVSQSLKDDRSFVMRAVATESRCLRHFITFKRDVDVVLTAVGKVPQDANTLSAFRLPWAVEMDERVIRAFEKSLESTRALLDTQANRPPDPCVLDLVEPPMDNTRKRLKKDPSTDRNQQRTVLVIGPGFGMKKRPEGFLASLRETRHRIVPIHPPPRFSPEGLQMVVQAIIEEKPDAIVCASRGGIYMTALWDGMGRDERDDCFVPKTACLMINAHPSCQGKQLPKDVPIIIVHGSNDKTFQWDRGFSEQSFQAAEGSLEALIRTGSGRGLCMLYYTRSQKGLRSRVGDDHLAHSLLQNKCLPRLLDSLIFSTDELVGHSATLSAALVPGPQPAYSFICTSLQLLSERRRQAEARLTYCPKTWANTYWKSDGQDSNNLLIRVDPESQEFQSVSEIFLAEPPREFPPFYFTSERIPTEIRNVVVRIERVENSGQEFELDQTRNISEQKLEAAGCAPRPGVHTRWLFHGPASAEVLQMIVSNPRQGFNRDYSRRQLWGSGIYFARDASYPVFGGFGSNCISVEGNKMMLLCLVECGLPTLGESFMAFYPSVHPEHHLDYATLVDDLSNPEIFCTVQNHQAHPAYVIHFDRHIGP